ncbi:MAG: hypothetical protein ABSH56_08890 [Bryobacteraceae bacterium]|jgi:hypothetical protein
MTTARALDGWGVSGLETRIRRARKLLLYTRESDPSFERRLRLLMRLVKERDDGRR